jgi:guanosine-3',5'-bis(diphosphate) 3'-pyrophosphohydrolase
MSITLQESQINDALAIAADVHRNQVRKEPDGRPYICHVLDVVNGLPNDLPLQDPNFKDIHLKRLVAALHDTIEDVADKDKPGAAADQKRAELRQKILAEFGPEVMAGVEAMTHLKPENLSEEAELAHYIDYIKTSVLPNDAAVAVKIIDNYVNMKDRVTQFVAGGKDAEKAREKLHQYACSIALLTEKKEKTAK